MLQLIYLGNGEIVRYQPDESDLLATERKVEALWQAIERALRSGDWRPRPGRICEWCAHQAICPAFGGTPTAPGRRCPPAWPRFPAWPRRHRRPGQPRPGRPRVGPGSLASRAARVGARRDSTPRHDPAPAATRARAVPSAVMSEPGFPETRHRRGSTSCTRATCGRSGGWQPGCQHRRAHHRWRARDHRRSRDGGRPRCAARRAGRGGTRARRRDGRGVQPPPPRPHGQHGAVPGRRPSTTTGPPTPATCGSAGIPAISPSPARSGWWPPPATPTRTSPPSPPPPTASTRARTPGGARTARRSTRSAPTRRRWSEAGERILAVATRDRAGPRPRLPAGPDTPR